MRWIRKGLYAFVAMLVILITGLMVLTSIDLGMFKDRFEVLVTDRLGREFRIDGTLQARIGTSFELVAEDIFLANPAWAQQKAFVTVGKIDFAVDVWSLIEGPIEIERLEIDGVSVNIEQNTAGDASWIFTKLMSRPNSGANDAAANGFRTVILGHAVINDTKISYDSPARMEPIIFVAESILSGIEADTLKVELVGSLNGTPVNFVKTSGPMENLLSSRNVSVEISGNIGKITIQGSGWIDDLLAPRRPSLELNIKGPNASYLTDILAMQAVTTGPLELSVSVKESGEQMIASLAGVFGEFNFDVDGRFQDLQELHNIDLDVSADGPDIGTLIRLSGREYTESDPFEIHGRIIRSGTEVTIEKVLVLIGASKLTVDGFFDEFPSPVGGNLSLQATGPDFGRFNRLFGMPGQLGGAFEASLNMIPNGDGRTRVALAADAPDISIKLDSLLSIANNFEGTTLQLELSGANIGTIASASGIDGLPAEKFSIMTSVKKELGGYRVSSFEAVVDDDVFRIDGYIADQPLSGETNLDIDFFGSNLGRSVIALGASAERLPTGAYYLRGSVRNQDEKLWLKDLRAAIGDAEEYQFQLTGFLTPREQFVDSRLKVHAQGASLAALAELAGQQGLPDSPFDFGVDIRRGRSNTHFDQGRFESGDLAVEFEGHVGDKPFSDDMALTFKASLTDMKKVLSQFGLTVNALPDGSLAASGSVRQKAGKLAVRQLEAWFNGAKLDVSADIGTLSSLAGTRLEFELKGDDLSRLLPSEASGVSLQHSFSASGKVLLSENELALEQFRAHIGLTRFSGDLAFSLVPFFDNGKFSLRADSPDIFQLLPDLEGVFIPHTSTMKYRGNGSWADNYWRVDHSKLELGEDYLKVNGTLDGPPGFAKTDLEVEWAIASIRKFSDIAGRELPDHPLRLNARLIGTDDIMTLENFDLTFGESDLHGHFTMHAGDLPTVKIDANSRLFDISEYLLESEEQASSTTPVAGHKVIPDTPLPLQLLRSFDADVSIEMDRVKTHFLDMKGVELEALVSAGALRIGKLSYTTKRDGYFSLSADLIPDGSGGADFLLAVDGKDMVMAFKAESEEELQHLPVFQINAELSGRGETVRSIAGSMDGYIRVVGGAGRIPAAAGSFFTQDFITELLSKVNPFTKNDTYTNVDCTVILLKLDQGVITGNPALVHQTEKLSIFADTSTDLKTEELSADFRMSARKGLGLSLSSLVNPFIMVTGTLGKPELVVDPKGILVEGSVAVASGGLSIVAKSFKNRFLSAKDQCAKALEISTRGN